jgi:RNA polymerase sigma factor (sigma-70 family)
MSSVTASAVVRQIESLFDGSSVAGLSDRQLIERFTVRRDAAGEAAFTALVARHGPMVMDICRQFLGDLHDAEDAFQAVFLVLARRAPTIRDPDLLANWLFGVALRTARQAKSRSVPMFSNGQGNAMSGSRTLAGVRVEPTDQPADCSLIAREQTEVLYQEIDRLPRPFRRTIVLHHLEGLTLEETARRLRCPAGTVRSRLARACEKLRRGLTRRGFALSTAAVASALTTRSASACVSSAVCEATSRAAVRFATKQVAAGVLSASAVALASDVLRSLLIAKLRIAALTCLVLGAVVAGGVILGKANGRQAGKPDLLPSAKSDPAVAKPAPGRMFVTGRVLDPNGKPVPNATAMVYTISNVLGKLPGRSGIKLIPIGDARADGSGRFLLDAPRTSSSRDHNFGATAIAPGFGVSWVALNPDAQQPGADITLRPEHVIHGRLFDVQGRPVPDVMISVSQLIPVGLPQVLNLSRARAEGMVYFWWSDPNDFPAWPRPVRTDAEGRFTVRGVGRNLRVSLTARHPRFALQRFEVETDGNVESNPLKFALEPAKVITGLVTYADTGKPVPHAQLGVTPRRGPTAYFETDADGRFRVNPPSEDLYRLSVWPPTGQPYLVLTRSLDWPKGAVEQSLDLALPRGLTIRGRVNVEGSGQPIAGATVQFLTSGVVSANAESQGYSPLLETAADGSFQMGAVHSPGWLFVMAASDDYVLQPISSRLISSGGPDGRRLYSHAHVPIELKPSDTYKEVDVTLRPGMTVKGQVVGPDGQPVRDAWVISRMIMHSTGFPSKAWVGDYHETALDGHFEIHGLDRNAEVPVHFLDPKRKF